MSLVDLLIVELGKLRRSLVLLLVFAVPAMVLILQTGLRVSGHAPPDWQRHVFGGAAIWASLLMPLSVTALTALLGQIEHGPRAWSATLSLPCPKSRIFAAKALLAALLVALMSVLLGLASIASGVLAGAVDAGAAPTGVLPLAELARVLGAMWIAGLLMLGLQFAVAMGVPNFAAAIITGVGGTFFAVAAASARVGIYFPWLLPVNILAADDGRAMQALLTGGLGGVVVLGVACVWLARRDWT